MIPIPLMSCLQQQSNNQTAKRVAEWSDSPPEQLQLAEASRALRKEAGHEGPFVPLTVARVRWRLGARGIV